MLRSIGLLVTAVILVVMTTGCVTSESGGIAQNADPDKAEATFVRLGLAYLQNGNRDASKENFEKALKINSRSAAANEGIARLYQLDAEKELAEKHFKLALRYDSTLSRAHNNYGNFLYDEGRYEEAYDQFEQAAENVSYENRAAALLNLGRTAKKLGRMDRARASFEHAANLRPNFAVVLEELAEITFQDGDYAKSKQYLNRHDNLTRPTARTLFLCIRIEHIFENRDREASCALQLKNLHQYSQELLDYREWVANNSE